MATLERKNRMILKADKALYKFIDECKRNNKTQILDVGCGIKQEHANIMRQYGLTVYTNDFFDDCDYNGKFIDIEFDKKFDGLWCSHCLEHQENVGLFLRKIKEVVKDDGIISITVPPEKGNIVGGHLTTWNLGLLYYNLIVAGFDCSQSNHKKYGYNISVVFNKKEIFDFPVLFYDKGDIELLAKYFPFRAYQGFSGDTIQDTF